MSEVTRVTIKASSPNTEAVSQPKAEEPTSSLKIESNEQAVADNSAKPVTSTEERPSWLPEKFKTPEDFKKSYEELEKKLGQPKDQEQKPEEEGVKEAAEEGEKTEEQNKENEAPKVNPAFTAATAKAREELLSTGELTEESYKAFEALGITKDIVDRVAAHEKADYENRVSSVYNEVGGVENYQAMARWAMANLAPEEIAAFDKATDVEKNSVEQVKLTVRGLYAKFSEDGKAPSLIGGDIPSSGSVVPFESTAQVVEAMKDKKYKNDPAFRKQVEARLAVSSVFNN